MFWTLTFLLVGNKHLRCREPLVRIQSSMEYFVNVKNSEALLSSLWLCALCG